MYHGSEGWVSCCRTLWEKLLHGLSKSKVFVSKFAFPARRSAAPEKLLGLGAPSEPSLLLWLGHHIGL